MHRMSMLTFEMPIDFVLEIEPRKTGSDKAQFTSTSDGTSSSLEVEFARLSIFRIDRDRFRGLLILSAGSAVDI